MVPMMSESNKLRQYMNLMESSLDEASLKDIAASAGNKLKAMAGDEQAQGTEDTKRLAKFLTQKFKKYAGQIGKMDEESLMTFLVNKVGFSAANARKLFAEVGIKDPTKTVESIKLSEELNQKQIDSIMTAAAQFAYKHNLIDLDSKDDIKPSSNTRRQSSNGKSDDDVSGLVDKLKGSVDNSNDQKTQEKPKDTNYTVDKFAFLDAIRSTGIDRRHLADLADIVRNAKSFDDVANRPDVKQLAMVGFAMFKAQQSTKK
jgi:hypothetical protein